MERVASTSASSGEAHASASVCVDTVAEQSKALNSNCRQRRDLWRRAYLLRESVRAPAESRAGTPTRSPARPRDQPSSTSAAAAARPWASGLS